MHFVRKLSYICVNGSTQLSFPWVMHKFRMQLIPSTPRPLVILFNSTCNPDVMGTRAFGSNRVLIFLRGLGFI